MFVTMLDTLFASSEIDRISVTHIHAGLLKAPLTSMLKFMMEMQLIWSKMLCDDAKNQMIQRNTDQHAIGSELLQFA